MIDSSQNSDDCQRRVEFKTLSFKQTSHHFRKTIVYWLQEEQRYTQDSEWVDALSEANGRGCLLRGKV